MNTAKALNALEIFKWEEKLATNIVKAFRYEIILVFNI